MRLLNDLSYLGHRAKTLTHPNPLSAIQPSENSGG